MSPTLGIGWVQIRSVDPPVVVTARLAADRPNVDQGYGGWTEVARPRRRPLSVWAGSPALRMTLPILLDRWQDGDSVEREIADLEKLGQPTASDGAPPRVRVAAPGGTVPHQGRVWVVDNLAWGDALANDAGNRCRQQVTLSLLEYIRDVRIEEDSAALEARLKALTAKSKAGAPPKRTVVNAGNGGNGGGSGAVLRSAQVPGGVVSFDGEDLLSIAARELGNAYRWVEIADLNGIRDPRTLTTGQVIRLP